MRKRNVADEHGQGFIEAASTDLCDHSANRSDGRLFASAMPTMVPFYETLIPPPVGRTSSLETPLNGGDVVRALKKLFPSSSFFGSALHAEPWTPLAVSGRADPPRVLYRRWTTGHESAIPWRHAAAARVSTSAGPAGEVD